MNDRDAVASDLIEDQSLNPGSGVLSLVLLKIATETKLAQNGSSISDLWFLKIESFRLGRCPAALGLHERCISRDSEIPKWS